METITFRCTACGHVLKIGADKAGRKAKRLSKITNVKQWRRVGLGMQLIAAGLLVWLAAYLLYRVPLVLGLALGEEYAAQADVDRLVTSPPDYGKPAEVNYTTYAIT